MIDAPKWFHTWADHHRAAFLLPAEWIDAAVIWWEVFAALAVTSDEMYAATREVQSAPAPPAGWGAHLHAIKTALGTLRDKVARANAAPKTDRGTCVDCGNTAVVVVPANVTEAGKLTTPRGGWVPYRHVRGHPRYATASVACACDAGRSLAASTAQWVEDKKLRRPLPALADYAKINPGWRDQLADRDAAERELHAAEHRAAERMAALGKVNLSGMLARIGTSPAGR